jgi:chromosome partitioning protein
MKAFLVANPKGGSGKSTLATNLAGYFASKRHEVMLGDIDRQQSSREWLGLRPFALPTIDTWEIGLDAVARPPRGTSHVILDTPAGLHGRMLERVLKLSTRVIVPVQPSIFDMMATRHFLTELLAEKAVRRGRADVAVIGMRVDARTRAAGELERFFATFDLPVLAYLRDTQIYVQASAAGMTIFDLPPSRAARDVEQWQAIIEWAEAGDRFAAHEHHEHHEHHKHGEDGESAGT